MKKPIYKRWDVLLMSAIIGTMCIISLIRAYNPYTIDENDELDSDTATVYNDDKSTTDNSTDTKKETDKTSNDKSTTEKPITTQEKTATAPVPMEYQNALKNAANYSAVLHLSKKGIYDMLISENGGHFSVAAAQYAIDNLQVDYKFNAMRTAKMYQNELSMSKEEIREQLSSNYGDGFTQEEANYAVSQLPD